MDRARDGYGPLEPYEQRRLQRERRRSAAGRSPTGLNRGLYRLEWRDEINRTEFGLKRDHCSIENSPGGAHPGTEQRAMSGSLMLRMVPGMFDRLCLSQSTDRNDTDYEEDRQELEGGTIHRQTTQCDLAECYRMPERSVKTATRTGPPAELGPML